MFNEGEEASTSHQSSSSVLALYEVTSLEETQQHHLPDEKDRLSVSKYLAKEGQHGEEEQYASRASHPNYLDVYRNEFEEGNNSLKQRKPPSPPGMRKRTGEAKQNNLSALSESEYARLRKRRSKEVGEGAKTRKQLTPLKTRQRWNPPFANLPPTPMTAYFDAETNLGGSEMSKSFASTSSPQTAAFLSSDYAASPALSSDGGISTDEMGLDDMGTDGSAGGLSLSSEIDTPGPVTPATPAWKPRELTLLRQKKGSDSPSESSNRAERERALIGLGLQTPSMPLISDDGIRSKRSSRILARDIFPLASGSQSKPVSPNPNAGPRELKLATSIGPPGSLRGIPSSRGSSSVGSSPMQSNAGSSMGRSPLPVLPPGPTFSPSSHQSSSSIAFQPSDNQRESTITSAASSDDIAILNRSIDEFPIVPDRVPDRVDQDLTPMTRSRKGSIAAPSPTSFIDSLSTGTRKKGPPAPLILAYSPASSYSHHSPNGSAPASAKSVLPTPNTSSFAEQIYDGLLNIPQTNHQSRTGDIPKSPLSPGGKQAFHTPLQSPAGAFVFPGEDQQSPVDKLSNLTDVENRETNEGQNGGKEEQYEGASGTVGAFISDEAGENQLDLNSMTLQEPDEAPVSSDAFEFETNSMSHSEATQDSSLQVEERKSKGSSGSESISMTSSSDAAWEQTVAPSAVGVAFDTNIFTSPLVLRRPSLEEEEQMGVAPNHQFGYLPALALSP